VRLLTWRAWRFISSNTLKLETPTGPVWHRYNYDGHGDHEDGAGMWIHIADLTAKALPEGKQVTFTFYLPGTNRVGRRELHRLRRLFAAGSDCGMLFGYDIAVISGAILFIKKDFSLSPGMEEIVVSSVPLGSLAGSVGGGMLADRLGRRRLLIVTAVVFGLGAIGAALAPGTAWLVVARVVAGAAIGIASFVAPLYISEIAPVDIRGLMFIPNSPRWLAGRGQPDQGRAVLQRIRPSEEVQAALNDIQRDWPSRSKSPASTRSSITPRLFSRSPDSHPRRWLFSPASDSESSTSSLQWWPCN
jgi:hypothetical protein